jgi:CubicO group peptidase (beta-lactamase class C family)
MRKLSCQRGDLMFHSAVFGRALTLCAVMGFPLLASPTRVAAQPLIKEDLEAFFDGIIPLQLERSDVAGATVLVMRGSETLLQKGYGFSDLKAKQAVDPESTIFRLASVSKLFTWTAVMQLVEQGKLDLDADINRYLDFAILGNKPITLRNLMTHTAGFEEVARDILVTDPKRHLDLREFLVQNQPHRLFAPGTVPGYSNYAVGLGSYIVQRVSGERFEDYVAAHVFAPLGMTHSTFYQPPQKALQDLPSQGYRSNTNEPAIGFELFSPAGAGGISSTAADMGRFGQMLLNGGEFSGQRILKAESLAEMWKPQFSANDQLPPIGLGFYQTWRNELKWIGHQGDLVAFHSLFFVEPQQKLVLFISYNSAGSARKTRAELLNAFSDRYFPSELHQPFIAPAAGRVHDIEGTYQSTRRADSTILKLFALFGQVHAKVDKDDVLHIDGSKDLRGHPFGWKPIGPDLWQQVDDQGKMFAIRAADGRIERLAGSFAAAQLQRVPWYDRDRFVFAMLGACVLIGISVLFNLLLRLVRHYVLRATQPIAPAGRLALSALPKATIIYWLLLLTSLAVFFSRFDDDSLPPSSSWDRVFLAGDGLFALAILLSAFVGVSAVRIWLRPSISRISQVKLTLVALACVYFSWCAIHWHLITPVHRF